MRRDLLARRIAPSSCAGARDVTTELPPKTIVVRGVELEGRQRDLCKPCVASMDKRVRDEIAAQGFCAQSDRHSRCYPPKAAPGVCDPLIKTDAAAKD